MQRSIGSNLFIALFLAASAGLVAAAEDDGFTGNWTLTVDEGRGERMGRLELRATDDGMVGHVEGGPVTLSIEGARIEMGVDDRTGGGDHFVRLLKGRLDGDVMAGRYGPDKPTELCLKFAASCPNPSGVWKAERIPDPVSQTQTPRPVDISGVWAPVRGGGGLGKYTMDITSKAQEWIDDFKVGMDMPNLRCVSAGLVRGFISAISAFEILQSDDRLTLISGTGEVRRIFIDGPAPTEFVPETPLGYSVGWWDGSTLVVDTTLLLPSVRGFRGEPTSDNARVVERYSLSEDGKTLSGVMTLHDPENYNKPPIRRRMWQRKSAAAIVAGLSCDPDYFYRELYESGRMQEYIDRESRRF